jgi:hypothetical protein
VHTNARCLRPHERKHSAVWTGTPEPLVNSTVGYPVAEVEMELRPESRGVVFRTNLLKTLDYLICLAERITELRVASRRRLIRLVRAADRKVRLSVVVDQKVVRRMLFYSAPFVKRFFVWRDVILERRTTQFPSLAAKSWFSSQLQASNFSAVSRSKNWPFRHSIFHLSESQGLRPVRLSPNSRTSQRQKSFPANCQQEETCRNCQIDQLL